MALTIRDVPFVIQYLICLELLPETLEIGGGPGNGSRSKLLNRAFGRSSGVTYK